MKKLSVKPVTKKEVEEKWGYELPPGYRHKELFVRCNLKGEVKWDSTLLYTKSELDKRGNYSIVDKFSGAIGYIKTSNGKLTGVTTFINPDFIEHSIIGMIYEINGENYWCTNKGSDVALISIEVSMICKAVLEKSIKDKTDFETELELYFDVRSGFY